MSIAYDTDKLLNHNHEMRRINVAIAELAQCMTALAIASNQGRRPDNAATFGGLAVGLRRAAYRAQFDGLDGFEEEEKIIAAHRAKAGL